jgi:hypothetical protein
VVVIAESRKSGAAEPIPLFFTPFHYPFHYPFEVDLRPGPAILPTKSAAPKMAKGVYK